MTLTITWAWLKSTALLAITVFLSALATQMVTVGVANWNLSAIHAAVQAAVLAVVSFLQSTLANLITPPSKPPAVIVPSALATRRLVAVPAEVPKAA